MELGEIRVYKFSALVGGRNLVKFPCFALYLRKQTRESSSCEGGYLKVLLDLFILVYVFYNFCFTDNKSN